LAPFRRRKYLVNTRLQLVYAGLVIWFVFNAILAIGATTYVIVLNTFLGELEETGTATVNVYGLVSNVNGVLMWRVGLLIVLLLPLAGMLAVYFLHRLAGPVQKIQQTLQDVLDGREYRPIVLRQHDHLGELAEQVNLLLEQHRQKDLALKELLAAAQAGVELRPLADQIAQRLAIPIPTPSEAQARGLLDRRGVSMIELAIVVAITGILAAIAITKLREMQLKAKRAELPVNVNGIKQALIAYDAANDDYLELSLNPRTDSALDGNAVAWLTTDANWESLGWSPDGLVRGNYQAGLSQVDHPGDPFMITARCDVDNDDALSEYTATERMNARLTDARAYLY
jgi:prepilin-type N-terminal cleavage/methylation domain-containing protein